MASWEKLASLEPWNFRPTLPDWWISEAYARDTEILTKALQKSFYNDSNITTTTTTTNNNNSNSVSLSETFTSDTFNPLLALINNETASAVVPPATPTASNVSASDPETAPKRQGKALPGPTGKVAKRKSRAKRSQTTFITADPANFRQMVQQVTGVRICNSPVPVVPVLKPELQRPGGRLQGCAGGGVGSLPTLDTSAFLLDHHQQRVVMGSTSGSGSRSSSDAGPGPISFPQPLVVADGGRGGAGSGAGSDFDAFSNFPTLESWKVM